MTMLDFNLWSWNSRVFPGIDSLNVRLGDAVRIRIGNLTMTNHPMHLHGHEFLVTGTDGGPTPKSTRLARGDDRHRRRPDAPIEFVADEPGDWAFHCHKSHHTMNAMGHDVPTMIGVDHRGVVAKITRLVPDYMVMGERGMADMAEMEMPLPDNTAADDERRRPVRRGRDGRHVHAWSRCGGSRRPGDYGDPGWYQPSAGNGRLRVDGAAAAEPPRSGATGGQSMPLRTAAARDVEIRVRKPGRSAVHAGH